MNFDITHNERILKIPDRIIVTINKHIIEGDFVVKENSWKAKYTPLEKLFKKSVYNILIEYPHLIK